MLDARRVVMEPSPRGSSHGESENECEGRPSLGTGGPPSECAKPSDNARSPLASAENGGGEPPALAAAEPAAKPAEKPLTPSKLKPPSAPRVNRFGFKNPVIMPFSPRNRGPDAKRPAGPITRSRTADAGAGTDRQKGLHRSGGRDDGVTERGAAGRSAVVSGRTRRTGAAPAGTSRVNTRSAAAPSSRRLSPSAGQPEPPEGQSVLQVAELNAIADEATAKMTSGSLLIIELRRQLEEQRGFDSLGDTRGVSPHKLAQPIAVSGRISRTATKVTPRLEFNAKGGASSGAGGKDGGILGHASPPEAKTKRGATVREGGGLALRRMHKSPRTSVDRDCTPSRTPVRDGRRGGGAGGGAIGGVKLHAQRIFTISDSEIEELVRTKPKKGASKWDYKVRIQSQIELLTKMRTTLDTVLKQKQLFKDACIDTESALKGEVWRVSQRCEDVERDHVELLDSNMKYQNMEAGYKADSKRANEERAKLGEVNKELLAQMKAMEEELGRAKSSTLKLRAMTDEKERRTNDAETQLALISEKLACAESRANESLTQKEQEWEVRIDEATSKALQEVTLQKAKVDEKEMEVEALTEDNSEMLHQIANLREELAKASGRAKDAEARLERGNTDMERLEEIQRRMERALETKNQEMSTTLSTFAISQRAAEQREQDLREDRRALEERVARLEEEKATLVGAMSSRDSSIASLTAEMNLLKEQLATVSSEASNIRGDLVEARVKADQSTEALAVERQSRLRAEAREEDERRERISTTANAQAMTTAHRQEMEEQKIVRAKQEAEWELRIENMVKEKDRLKEAIIVAEERELELEAKVRSLTASLEDAQTNSEQLEELSRAKAEIKVMHHRLETLNREKNTLTEEAMLKMSELEAKVVDGEAQRRLMHNLIQELRGNVRVFARVRPFLPSDNVPDDAEPAVVSKGDGTGCILSKHVVGDGKDYGDDMHFFAFDKSFAPSAGQEEVFTEVSEFVQSALDGFNVCLFSYGQTGSGKTHTMQGSGAGTMRGIIPRAMEQVGKYKSKLEAQGWEYDMMVSFLEIYNEQIKDLLRPDPCSKDVKHEIKRDNRGNISVSDLTTEAVDPNDSTVVDDIMQRAACLRSVGRTDMNEQSSRSHSVFTLYLKAINRSQRSTVKGTLHLVDLAGSERLGRSHAKGDRLKETVAINKSLSALTDVFVAISNKSSHIPFRNSKLTYLLQPALSGDGKTLMMVNLSPTEESYHETLCSLRFASQVNQCELGRPKRNLRDMGSTDTPSGRGIASSSRVRSSGR